MNTDKEKFSYTMGQQIGAGILNDRLNVDAAALAQGIQDRINGDPSKLTDAEMQTVIREFQKQTADRTQNMAANNQAEGEAFLESNKKEEGIKISDSGLQYQVLAEGDGETPSATQRVSVHYHGSLIDGTVFDSSIQRGEPAVFPVNGVIQGWQEALQMMPVGSKWKVFIPPHLAYGEQGAGGAIGPNQTLIFEMELLGIE